MDFLTKTSAQLNEFFRSMTPGARIASGLLLAVVVTSLAYLFAYRGASADHYLMNGQAFSASDLPAMEEAFAKAGLNNYEFEGTKIRVPRGQQNLYLAALADNSALPPNFNQLLDEPGKGTGPFDSPEVQKHRYKVNVEKVLAAIISKMAGIKEAYVVYDTEKGTGLTSRDVMKTVSVSVKPLGSHNLADSVLAIRTLVVTAIASLKPENVSVTDLSGGVTYPGTTSPGGGIGGGDDPVLAAKKKYEKDYKEKILAALSYVPGVTVAPNVEIDPQQSYRQEQLKPDAKGVPLHTKEKSRSNNSEGGSSPGGRPGTQSQQPNSPRELGTGGKGSHQENEDSDTDTDFMVGTTRTTTEKAGLTPKSVTVAIGVPNKYFLSVWQARNPASDKTPDQAALDQIRTEETAKIKQYVATLLPKPEGAGDVGQLVQVTSFQDITPPPMPAPPPTEFVLAWLSQYGSTVGMAALALVGLLMLRSVIRAVPAGQRPTAQESRAEDATAEPAPEPSRAPAAPRLRRFSTSGPSLRDELSQRVQEDPDSAANVLRAWIGTPAGKS